MPASSRAVPVTDPIGGQAVLEGVMLRGGRAWAVAVRAPDGRIVVRREELAPLGRAHRVPVLRGVVALCDSVRLGLRALAWSASVASGVQVRLGPAGLAALCVAVPVFMVAPALAAAALSEGRLAFGALDAAFGTALLVGYIAAVGRMAQIRRFFEYHGAEHKAVAAHEAGGAVDVGTAAGYGTRHARCGTTFLLVVALLAAAANTVVGRLPPGQLIGARLLIAPLVAGLAYEWLRFSAARTDRGWVRALMAPGLALQRLTTREPDRAQLEVAVAALHAVVAPVPPPSPDAAPRLDAPKGLADRRVAAGEALRAVASSDR